MSDFPPTVLPWMLLLFYFLVECEKQCTSVQQQICLTIAHVIYGDFGIRFQNEVKEAGLHSIYLVKPQLNSVSTLSFFA